MRGWRARRNDDLSDLLDELADYAAERGNVDLATRARAEADRLTG